MSLNSSVSTACAVALLATAASATAAPIPKYATAASLQAADGALAACYEGETGRTNGCQARVGEQIWQAFRAVVAQMFQMPRDGTPPDVRLEISRPDAHVERNLGYPLAMINQTVVISSSSGVEIDRVHARGMAEVLGDGPQSVSAAFERASNDTAASFEHAFANSESIADWLNAKVAPVGSSIVGPGRGELVGFVDGAVGGVNFAEGYNLSARAGLAGRWFVAQAVVQTWTRTWGFYSDDMSVTAIGFEAGPVWRLGRNWEVRAGAGLHWASGSLDKVHLGTQPSGEFSRTMPAVFGAVQYAFWPGRDTDTRLRIGTEIRTFFDDDAPVDSIRKVYPIGGTTVSVSFGIEFGFIKSRVPTLR